MAVIYLVCASILFFVGGSFVLKQKKAAADHIVIAWIILELATQISYYLLETGGYSSNIRFFQVVFGTHLLHAPMLYFYVVALLDRNFAFSWKSLVHLSPIIVFYVMHIPEFAKSTGLAVCSNHFGCYFLNKPCSLVFNFSKLLLNTFYITITAFTYRELVRGKDRVEPSERLDRQWVKVLIGAAFALNLLIILTRLLEVSQVYILSSRLFIINLAATLFVLVFTFLGVNFRNIHGLAVALRDYILRARAAKREVCECITEAIGSACGSRNVETYGISDELMSKYEQQLRHAMEEKRLYLEHQLTKAELSRRLQIPEHHLGAVLRLRFCSSFNDFINSYRLAELLQKLADPSNDAYTLLGLAYDCGFNSKSTFNRFFKSQMGVTPSEWVRSSAREVSPEAVGQRSV